jgi:hypothetical protein
LKERSDYIYDPKLAIHFIEFIKINVDKQEKMSQSVGVPLKNLEMGMYLAEDINLQNGMLLIPRGVILDQTMLEKVNSFDTLLDMDRVISIVG